MTACKHIVTRRQPGETGYLCVDCGALVMEVDPRPCADCAHHRRLIGGSICKLHLMAVAPAMHVCYHVDKGSCWTAQV